MTTTQEALNNAREALSEIAALDYSRAAINGCAYKAVQIASSALSALQASAEAQPSQEPVAWMTEDGRVAMDATKRCMPSASKESFNIPLYVHPQPSAPVAQADAQPSSDEFADRISSEGWDK